MPKHIGLDLGTSNTRMFIKGKGIVLRSPTVVTVEKYKDRVVALGSDAKKMIGKTPSNMEAYRPIRNGVIADFEVAAMMIHEYFVKTEALSLFNRPVVLVPRSSDLRWKMRYSRRELRRSVWLDRLWRRRLAQA